MQVKFSQSNETDLPYLLRGSYWFDQLLYLKIPWKTQTNKQANVISSQESRSVESRQEQEAMAFQLYSVAFHRCPERTHTHTHNHTWTHTCMHSLFPSPLWPPNLSLPYCSTPTLLLMLSRKASHFKTSTFIFQIRILLQMLSSNISF